MQKIPLREGDGPYSIPKTVINQETNRLEEKEILFNVRPYGETENAKPSVFVISESSKNTGGDIATVAPEIGADLCEKFGFSGFDPSVNFIVHYPENVKGDNPETFVKAQFGYDGPSPRWNRRLSEEISSDDVAKLIGPENMEHGYDSSPRQSQNPLVQQAFKSGIDR